MAAVLKPANAPTRADFHEAISRRSNCWFSVCLRLTRSRDLAEDAVQDALLTAWNKRQQFDGSARLETWIHRIVVNAALQLLRKQKPGRHEPLEIEPAGDGKTPDAAHFDAELGDQLSAALGHLSDMERACFVLKHLEEWRIREIADELGMNNGAVKQAIFRAVRKLRTHMTGLLEEAR